MGNDKVLYRLLAIVASTALLASVLLASGCTRPTEAQSAAQRVPQVFLEEFGGRYADPVSTYYAEQAYQAANNRPAVLTDSAIKTYGEGGNRQEHGSALGFDMYRLPLKTEINEATSIAIFNTYTAKQLSLYLNYLAKNPTPEDVAVIDTQFMNYSSNTIGANLPASAFVDDDTDIATLMTTAKAVVAKYGSAANYTVEPGAIDSTDPNSTSFKSESIMFHANDDKSVAGSTIEANVVVTVDVYDGTKVSRTTEVVEGANLTILRQPNIGTSANPDDFTFVSIGQFDIQ